MAQDPNRLYLDRGLSIFDVPQLVKFNYVYNLPFGRGRSYFGHMRLPLDLLLGGWRTAGVWTMRSGFPLTFIASGGGTPIYTYGFQRPNLVGTPTRTGGSDGNWVNNYFANPNVFQLPAPYTLGNAPRTEGAVRTPFLFASDLSIAKDFSFSPRHENMKLELRMDAANAFNHPVFGTPDTGVGDPNFGVINYTANSPRQMQLSLKLTF